MEKDIREIINTKKWPSKEEKEKVISGIRLRIHDHFVLKNASSKNLLPLRASYFSYKNYCSSCVV